MPDTNRGLYGKYYVTRTDGRDKPDADYFVLDITSDPGAIPALKAYILWCYENDYERLAQDLEVKLVEKGLADW